MRRGSVAPRHRLKRRAPRPKRQKEGIPPSGPPLGWRDSRLGAKWEGGSERPAFVCLMSLDIPTSAAVDIGVSRYRWRQCCLFCAYHRVCVFFSAYTQALTQGASQPASVASGLSSAQPPAQTQGASQPASVASGLSNAQPPALTQGASQPASVASGLSSAYNMFKGVHFVECNNSVWLRRSIQLRLLYIPYHYNVY